jgi:hypothetical protein
VLKYLYLMESLEWRRGEWRMWIWYDGAQQNGHPHLFL